MTFHHSLYHVPDPEKAAYSLLNVFFAQSGSGKVWPPLAVKAAGADILLSEGLSAKRQSSISFTKTLN